MIVFRSTNTFTFVLAFSFVSTHVDSYKRNFVSLLPCKNSLVRKSGRELVLPLINSISKSKAERIAGQQGDGEQDREIKLQIDY